MKEYDFETGFQGLLYVTIEGHKMHAILGTMLEPPDTLLRYCIRAYEVATTRNASTMERKDHSFEIISFNPESRQLFIRIKKQPTNLVSKLLQLFFYPHWNKYRK